MSSASQLGRDRPLVLVVMDGVGVGQGDAFDAVALANTPNLDQLVSESCRTLRAHGTAVGLPSDADMGNSEVGHNILGAGRIFDQGAKRVDNAIASGSIWKSNAWREIVDVCAGGGGTLHLIGLLSDGNVHSNISHLFEIFRQAAEDGISTIRVHALLDGRDVPDPSAERYIARTQDEFAKHPNVDIRFASGGGRMVTTMDRYGADWRIVEAGWHAHVLGTARPVPDLLSGVEWGRSTGVRSDQLLPAFTIVDESQQPVGSIVDGDAVVFFNFRGDRAIELSQAFEAGPEFDKFDRVRVPDVLFAGMALYDGDTNTPASYLVLPESVDTTVSEIIASAGIAQWAGAETQKFGHITYFWNGNRSNKFDDRLETYVEIPSDLVPFNERPWMKSAETADAAIEAVRSGEFGFIRMNFAGGDMVGHTADLRRDSHRGRERRPGHRPDRRRRRSRVRMPARHRRSRQRRRQGRAHQRRQATVERRRRTAAADGALTQPGHVRRTRLCRFPDSSSRRSAHRRPRQRRSDDPAAARPGDPTGLRAVTPEGASALTPEQSATGCTGSAFRPSGRWPIRESVTAVATAQGK